MRWNFHRGPDEQFIGPSAGDSWGSQHTQLSLFTMEPDGTVADDEVFLKTEGNPICQYWYDPEGDRFLLRTSDAYYVQEIGSTGEPDRAFDDFDYGEQAEGGYLGELPRDLPALSRVGTPAECRGRSRLLHHRPLARRPRSPSESGRHERQDMTGDDPDLDYYLCVYQASARLFWRSSRPWPDTLEGQPQECRDAWAHLEQVLAETFPVPTDPGAPSDPTRHLVTRRGSDNRPVTLSDAAHDWLTRVQEQPGAPYPRDIIAEHPEMHGQKTLTTNFVLVTNDWCAMAMKMVGELQHRLAPGRPACTISADAQGLPDTLRHAADQLRTALVGHSAPPPAPDTPSRGSSPVPLVRDIDSERLDRLCWAAFDVVEHTPGLAAVKAGEADTPDVQISKAVDVLRRTLAGEELSPWRGFNPRVDPADSLVGSSEDLTFTDYLNRIRTGLLTDQPAPWVPTEPVIIDTGDESIAYTGIPFPAANVLIEMLEEVAARLIPGTRTETIGIDTYHAYYDLAGIRGILHRL